MRAEPIGRHPFAQPGNKSLWRLPKLFRRPRERWGTHNHRPLSLKRDVATATASNRAVTAYGSPAFAGTTAESMSPARGTHFRKPFADPQQKRVADLAIGFQLLLAAAFGAGGIMRRPVFDVGRHRAPETHRLV